MKPSRQAVLDNFKRECPSEVLKTYTDEGLEIILDDIESEEREDGEESEIDTQYIGSTYCEESYAECIESLKIKVDLTQAQGESGQQMLMQDAIKQYLEARGALIGFTSAHRVVSTAEVIEETLEEFNATMLEILDCG